MKRVVVTGASGFIGRHCLAPLAARGFEVHALARAPPARVDAAIRWHALDLHDAAATHALLQAIAPTHLLHLAWYAVPGKFWNAPENLGWVAASIRLLEAFSAAGGRRVVSAGSCAEYDWSAGHCAEATTALAPHSYYGRCKNALRQLGGPWCAQQGVASAWGRVFFLYGPHEHPDRLVASVARALLRGEAARCTHGEQLRDFLHVADVAAAFVALLDSTLEGPVNIGSGEAIRIRDVVTRLAQQAGRPDLLQLGALPAPAGEPLRLTADVARLSGELGWRPRYDLASGLDDTLAWWRSQAGDARPNPGVPS